MTEIESNPVLVDEPAEIEAFGFVPEWTSAIAGLGGASPSADRGYAFHTAYYGYGEGDVLVTLLFQGLAATRGTLFLRVNAYPQATAVAYEVVMRDMPMGVVAVNEGTATIRFTPRPGTSYAILGHIYDDTDAVAVGLRIRVERNEKYEEAARLQVSQRRSAFAAAGIRPVAHLTANDPPLLAHPVSQMCTPAQLLEPVYAQWLGRIGQAAGGAESWAPVYILQALQTYGMLQEGALGVELGGAVDPLAAMIASFGCSVVVTDGAATGLDAWRRPHLCADEMFDRRISFRRADPRALLPELVGFDFLWSQPEPDELGSVANAADFIFSAIQCVKPGGLAVHVVPVEPETGEPYALDDPATAFRQIDLDRLALKLIGHGHEVAQLNHRGDPCGTPAPFGLIVRRGLRT